MNVHKNARLTPKGREAMVRDVTDRGLTQAEAARRHSTTEKSSSIEALVTFNIHQHENRGRPCLSLRARHTVLIRSRNRSR